jgi:hypothetical protein
VIGTYTLKGDAKLASFTPHMHDRGKDFRYEATLPDGTTRTLLSVRILGSLGEGLPGKASIEVRRIPCVDSCSS